VVLVCAVGEVESRSVHSSGHEGVDRLP
jgi:hypothetical protein